MPAPQRAHPNLQIDPAMDRITNFEHFVQLLSRWEGSFEQLSCGRFEGTLCLARGKQSAAHLATANQALVVRGREGAGILNITLVVPESAGCLWQGRRLDSGHLVVRSGEVGVDHRTSRRAVNLGLVLSEEGFRRTARILTRTNPEPLGWYAMRPPPDVFGKFETMLRAFLASARPGQLGSNEVRLLEQACLSAAVEALSPVPGRRIDLPYPARAALVRRADELMRAHFRTPVGEIELCAALGVSGRTLRLAFRERFGLGPMAYYQTLRLNAARAALIAADPETVSVAVIADRLGFCHPGKFAGYYRRLFGEVPSKTVSMLQHCLVPIAS